MSCGCSTEGNGKAIVDLVRSKGKQEVTVQVHHNISCSCGKIFTMTTAVDSCPHCGMTYGVTPCSSDKIENVKAAGINY